MNISHWDELIPDGRIETLKTQAELDMTPKKWGDLVMWVPVTLIAACFVVGILACKQLDSTFDEFQ